MDKNETRKMVHFAPLPLLDTVRLLYTRACNSPLSESDAMQLLRDSGVVETILSNDEIIVPEGTILPYKSVQFAVGFKDGDIDVTDFEKILKFDATTLIVEARNKYEVPLEKEIAMTIQIKKKEGTLLVDDPRDFIVVQEQTQVGARQ